MRVGPFWRQYPTSTTTGGLAWRWCYLWLDSAGDVTMIEWIQ